MSVTVWDGLNFHQMDEKEARRERKADRVQILDKFTAGHELKFRNQFTGYSDQPAARSEPAPMPSNLSDWQKHRKAAADHFGKPFIRVRKVDVIAYLERAGA